MHQNEQDNKQHPTTNESVSERRAWITPTFDKVALKDALNDFGPTSLDGVTSSS